MGFTRKRKGTDGETRYMAIYRDPAGGVRSAGTFEKWEDAQVAWKNAEAAIRGNRWIDPVDSTQTFGNYVKHVWGPNKKAVVSINTWTSYQKKLTNHILPTFEQVRMDHIRRGTVKAWVAELTRKGVTPQNLVTIFRVMRLIMSDAVEDEVVTVNPCTGLDLPPVPKKKIRVIEDEVATSIETAILTMDERWRVMTAVALATGVRFGELRALRPRHFNFVRREVHIVETLNESTKKDLDEREAEGGLPADNYRIGRSSFYVKEYTKGEDPRSVPLDPSVAEMVETFIKDHEIGPDDLLFTTPRFGNPVGYGTFRKRVWNPLVGGVGAKGVRVHDMRHSVASWLLAGGADIGLVMRILGHKQITTTQLYVHALQNEHEATLSALRRGRTGK